MSDVFVKSFTHLTGRPKSERAVPMLRRIASLVKPIMRKHGWVLPVLAEFFPDSPNLVGLNINGGEKILLRLRPAWDPDNFYEEDQVVRVMLHELTHNVHGRHDEVFYKYLSGLEDEYDALQRSGYAGEGFHSKGHRLGTNVSHDLPPHLVRAKALEAAEKRRKLGSIMSGGSRLGGRNTNGMTPRELAAQAAQRRAEDEKACGSGAIAEREAAKAAKESIESGVIDLTAQSNDLPSPSGNVAEVSSRRPPHIRNVPSSSTERYNPYPGPTIKSRTQKSSLSDQEWSCPICTLVNTPMALQCDACQSQRPLDQTTTTSATTWTCFTCGESGMPPEFWTCRFCGTVKLRS